MISGRAVVVLGLVGVGLYVMRRGADVASTMQGLGADLTQADIDAQEAAGMARIAAINAMPIVLPPLPKVGPVPLKPS